MNTPLEEELDLYMTALHLCARLEEMGQEQATNAASIARCPRQGGQFREGIFVNRHQESPISIDSVEGKQLTAV